MRYYFLTALLMFVYKNARAEEVRPYEFRFLPGYVGYSNYNGAIIGGSAAFAVNLDKRWQWEWGAFGGLATRGHDVFSVFTGPRFNISEDRSRSWFVGLGLEYGDRWDCVLNCYGDKEMSGYVEVGKRFRMNDSGTWTYMPSVTFETDGHDEKLSIRPATFSYSF